MIKEKLTYLRRRLFSRRLALLASFTASSSCGPFCGASSGSAAGGLSLFSGAAASCRVAVSLRVDVVPADVVLVAVVLVAVVPADVVLVAVVLVAVVPVVDSCEVAATGPPGGNRCPHFEHLVGWACDDRLERKGKLRTCHKRKKP
jgi:hypothetical protein